MNPSTTTEPADETESAPLSTECPRSKLDLLNLRTGDRIALRCKSNRCFVCGPINARMIAWAQARSEPERLFRLSLVPTSWTTARLRIKQVRERLTDLGYRQNEWAFSLEPNPSGDDLAHAHGVQHGHFIPQDVLQDVCQANGLGIPYIAAIKGQAAGSRYGVKAAAAAFYGVKSAKEAQDRQGDYERFLDLNGGRISHHTRGFYRLPSGQRVTQGEAIAALVAEIQAQRSEEEQDQWQIVGKATSLPSARLKKLRVLGTPSADRPL